MTLQVGRIISGGQTGADRGGLEAAIELAIPHGGRCPRGRRAEDGRIPAKYQLKETSGSSYPERTKKNVQEADATIVFTYGAPQGGSALTLDLAKRQSKPFLNLNLEGRTDDDAVAAVHRWIDNERVRVLNVAGSRESNAPGIAERVQRILVAASPRQ